MSSLDNLQALCLCINYSKEFTLQGVNTERKPLVKAGSLQKVKGEIK